MDLVYGDGGGFRLTGGSCAHPVTVRPWERLRPGNDGCASGSRLACASHRIGFLRQELAIGPDQFVLVALARAETRDEELPDSGLSAQTHGVTPPVPAVEVTDYGDTLGIRRPDSKAHAGHAFDRYGLSAEHVAELVMRAL